MRPIHLQPGVPDTTAHGRPNLSKSAPTLPPLDSGSRTLPPAHPSGPGFDTGKILRPRPRPEEEEEEITSLQPHQAD
jgi:hypothetical protein